MNSKDADNKFDDKLDTTRAIVADTSSRNISPRTSMTSPLRIDTIELAFGKAAVGMTLCPGKQGFSEYGRPWLRDLKQDMTVLKEWGCNVLLTLMESDELKRFHVFDIGEIAEGMGIKWYHIPITDGSPPDERFKAVWPSIGRILLNTLKNGGRIVIHCRGGLGRTGLIACLLLIELGTPSQEALHIVRLTRPGAVETVDQEHFIQVYKPILI